MERDLQAVLIPQQVETEKSEVELPTDVQLIIMVETH